VGASNCSRWNSPDRRQPGARNVICCGASGGAPEDSGLGGGPTGVVAWRPIIAHQPSKPRHGLRHEPVEPRHVRCAGEARLADGRAALDSLLSAVSDKRRVQHPPGLCTHDRATPLACLAEHSSARPMVDKRTLSSSARRSFWMGR